MDHAMVEANRPAVSLTAPINRPTGLPAHPTDDPQPRATQPTVRIRNSRRPRQLRRVRDRCRERRPVPPRPGVEGRRLPGRRSGRIPHRRLERNRAGHRSRPLDGWLGASLFDLRSILHAVRHRDLCLTFGYNTAIFNTLQRLLRIPNVINMDGIEWSRARWGRARQSILWTNERIACLVGDALIADHPEIAVHLATRAPERKITTIAYGAHPVTEASTAGHRARPGPGAYLTLICRPIPENTILELVAPSPDGSAGCAWWCSAPPTGRGRVPPGGHGRCVRRGRLCRRHLRPRLGDSAAVPRHRLPARPHRRRDQPLAGRGDGGRQRDRRHDGDYNRWVAADPLFRTEDGADAADHLPSSRIEPSATA